MYIYIVYVLEDDRQCCICCVVTMLLFMFFFTALASPDGCKNCLDWVRREYPKYNIPLQLIAAVCLLVSLRYGKMPMMVVW